MSKPLISVIMTVRNCSRFVKESIESIDKQTFRDFEVIIYNDYSTDNTLSIVEDTLKKVKFKYTLMNRLVGCSVGCNRGRTVAIKESTGKYLAVQDGDDISFSERFEEEVNILEENDNIFCVSSWADRIDEHGNFIELMNYPPETHEEIYKEIVEKHNNPIIDPSSMFRKDIFDKLGGYDKKWSLVPDFNLWARAAIDGYRFENVQRSLVFYRRHPDSVTNKREMDVVREHYKMCKEVLKAPRILKK